MKAGTTSLYRWLESTGLVAVPDLKEPNFFTSEWARGLDWYRSLFTSLPRDLPSGEASVSYSDPIDSLEASSRIATALPEARLVFIARHPLDRLRSHYRHEVQRHRETRPFAAAVADLDSAYVRRSLYGRALLPYYQVFPPEQLLVVGFDELIHGKGFARVLAHLGLPEVARPTDKYNVTADKRRYTPAARWLFERGWTTPLRRLPRPVRKIGKRMGTRIGTDYLKTLEGSKVAAVPGPVIDQVVADVDSFERLSGRRFGWVIE